jgi:hypothetical protein
VFFASQGLKWAIEVGQLTMKARVFLSYARSDGTVACDFFQKSLQNAGYWVWRDIDDLAGGADWQNKIEETIRVVDVVLLFLTPGAIDSTNVVKEWQTAIRFQKRVVPLLVGAVTLPDELRRYNYRDIQDPGIYQLEPSVIQKGLEVEQAELRTRFEQLRATVAVDIANSAQQKYLEPFVEYLRMTLDAEPSPLPPEVLRMLFSLLAKLTAELSAGRDITALVESLAAGDYRSSGWDEEEIYKLGNPETKRILNKVRDAIPTTPVNVVVVSMTRAEAEDLESGKAFADMPAEWLQDFNSIRPTIPDNWLSRYGKTAEDWEPFAGEGSIASLIRGELKQLSADLRKPLRYSYIEVRDVALPDRRKNLLDLRADGCLVIMDAVSSWHPKLHAAFRSTSLDVSPATMVVRVLPDETLDNVLTKVGFLLHEWLTCDFFHRFNIDLDGKCDTVSKLTGFRRWFHGQLRNIAPSATAQQSDLRQHINNFIG